MWWATKVSRFLVALREADVRRIALHRDHAHHGIVARTAARPASSGPACPCCAPCPAPPARRCVARSASRAWPVAMTYSVRPLASLRGRTHAGRVRRPSTGTRSARRRRTAGRCRNCARTAARRRPHAHRRRNAPGCPRSIDSSAMRNSARCSFSARWRSTISACSIRLASLQFAGALVDAALEFDARVLAVQRGQDVLGHVTPAARGPRRV